MRTEAPTPVGRVEPMWGTVIGVDVRDPVDIRVVDDVFDWFRRVDDLFSTWRTDTEISRIGRGDLNPANASPEVREVLAACEQLRVETGGAFDISVGASAQIAPRPGLAPLDPSGFVKGWALERAELMFEAAGAARFCINGGGDVVVRGRRCVGPPWRIGVQHPWQRDKLAAVVEITRGAVATSGRTERGDHVINPETRRPATGLVSVTVVGPDLGVADALATAAVAAGSIGGPWLTGRADVEALAVTDGGTVVSTPDFHRYRTR